MKVVCFEGRAVRTIDGETGQIERYPAIRKSFKPLLYFGDAYVVGTDRNTNQISIINFEKAIEYKYDITGDRVAMLSQFYLAVFTDTRLHVLSLDTMKAQELEDSLRSKIVKCFGVDDQRLATVSGDTKLWIHIYNYKLGVKLFEYVRELCSWNRVGALLLDANYLLDNLHCDIHSSTFNNHFVWPRGQSTRHGIYNLTLTSCYVMALEFISEYNERLYQYVKYNSFIDVFVNTLR